MKPAYKKIIFKILLIMILFLNLLGIKSFALVEQSNEFYVNDTANLLDSDVENYIIETNKKINAATGAQIVVVTVNNLEGQSLEEYATALFRKYGIGNKKKNNGVLLLLALEERQFRIEVGYGLEGVLNDAKTGRIQDDYIIPYLKDDNWNEGVRNGYSKVLEEVSNEYGVDVGEINVTEPSGEDDGVGGILFMAVITVMSPIIFSIKKKWKVIILVGDIIVMILTLILSVIFTNIITDSIAGSLLSAQFIVLIMTIFSIISNSIRWRYRRFLLWRRFIRRRILIRRRFFWWRRLFRWRRFFKRILNWRQSSFQIFEIGNRL